MTTNIGLFDLPVEILQIIVDNPLCNALDRTILLRVCCDFNKMVKNSESRPKILTKSGTCSYAASNGHLEVLKYVRENGCPWDSYTCSSTAYHGYLEVLKWARENGCPWDSDTCSYAALNGHLEVLKWAHENGCPWDSDTCYDAASNGHLEVLKWARENGCPYNFTEYTIATIKNGKHRHIIDYLVVNNVINS